ncbi:3638_t:CDS:2 [Scutellospora calospora]|uniref:3638_t:CDS:1 n=1 Tax=Scutellospora calospora TaxID=85575 RepID=A0ACA9M9U7_9GLOM|nr:3638_t:CDS:2 [Scutellospora calospora]
MIYSPEEKRKIILDNYRQPSQQVELAELKKKSAEWQVPFDTFHSLEAGCGDIIHLLIKKKDNYLEKCLFSGQQSCLITVAAANILCSGLEKKNLQFAQKILNNCEAMVEKKEHNLENCPDFQVFSDISHELPQLNPLVRFEMGVSDELTSKDQSWVLILLTKAKLSTIAELATKRNAELKFLLGYSPKLNLVEKCFDSKID